MIKNAVRVVVLYFAIVASAFAEIPGPELVVKELIRSAQTNDLDGILRTADLVAIAEKSRHGMAPDALVGLLRSVGPGQVKLMTLVGIDQSTNVVFVRMISPRQLDFALEFRPRGGMGKPSHYYRVIAVTP